MIRTLGRMLRRRGRRPHPRPRAAVSNSAGVKSAGKGEISSQLDENIRQIRSILGRSDDVVFRMFTVQDERRTRGVLIFSEGLVNHAVTREHILEALSRYGDQLHGDERFAKLGDLLDNANDHVLTADAVGIFTTYDDIIRLLLSGHVAVFLDGDPHCAMVDARGRAGRGVQQPVSESIVRGPRDSFTETLEVNIALIRRRIRDPNLQVEMVQSGRRTKTDLAIMYINGIVNPRVLKEVRTRLDTIDVDSILESGYVEQLVEDEWLSPFPQMADTERPDAVAAGLLEGRVAIFCDNTPFALVVPSTLLSQMQSPSDAYHRWVFVSSIRYLRMAALTVALLLPAVYVALTSFHVGLIPTELALAIAGSRENIPFPAFAEAFFLELALELLREAAIRLPQQIGPTIGIVGGLIIGEAVVQANLVSPIMVIVVATTAIASFVIPSYSLSLVIRTLRFGFLILAAILGLYGIVIGILLLLVHMSSLKSFGVGYLEPMSPTTPADLRDSLVRLPLPGLPRRPAHVGPVDTDRLDDKRQDKRDRLKTGEHD